MSKAKKLLLAVLAVTAVIGTVTFITKNDVVQASEGAAAPAAPQAMPVDLETVTLQDIQIWKNFSGNVVAVDRAEIRPQVSGRITEVRFEDGQRVEKGDVLVVIDPRPFEVQLEQAKAALAAAVTAADLAEKEYQRGRKLVERKTVSQSAMDSRTNARNTARAAVNGAKATVEAAEIDLDYAYVKAPISGKVGRAEVTEGNLVQNGSSAPVLTTIIADEQVYVDFEVDENTYIKLVKDMGQDDTAGVPVRVKLSGDATEYDGVIQSFDNHIDRASGTIRARAVFDNSEKMMLPGMSVTVLMGGSSDNKKILISERAIGTDQDRKFVYTVNGDGVAEYREIKIGESMNGKRVVLSGLNEGEKVIASGIVRIRPGVPVVAKSAHAANTDEPQATEPASGEAAAH